MSFNTMHYKDDDSDNEYNGVMSAEEIKRQEEQRSLWIKAKKDFEHLVSNMAREKTKIIENYLYFNPLMNSKKLLKKIKRFSK